MIINLHAIIPVKKAEINPIINNGEIIRASLFELKRILLAMLPKIRGMTIKKENLAASVLLTPNITAKAIVAPLLDIPGIIAIA